MMNFSRRLLVGVPSQPRTAGIPGLTEKQAEALDAVHFTAKAHSIAVSMKRGDIRFMNNLTILHGRQAFWDDSSVRSQRHLMRLWLHDEEKCWKLPPALLLAWARVFDDKSRDARWDVDHRDPTGEFIVNLCASCD